MGKSCSKDCCIPGPKQDRINGIDRIGALLKVLFQTELPYLDFLHLKYFFPFFKPAQLFVNFNVTRYTRLKKNTIFGTTFVPPPSDKVSKDWNKIENYKDKIKVGERRKLS